MNIYSPVISGSLTITGSTTIIGSVTITSGSLISTASNAMALDGTGSLAFVTTASYNPTSASFSSILTSVSSSQQQISASLLQVSASYISLSGSYNIFSGSTSTRITTVSASQQDISASLLQVSASYISLSGSYNIFSGSASTRITENSASIQQVSSSQQDISASLLNVIATYATTGSNSFRADQSITGSLVVSSTITAQTLVVQTVTSSIVYSSGSNNFGNQLANTQTFTGSVNITGSLALAGNITGNAITLTGAVTFANGGANYLYGGSTKFLYSNGTSTNNIYCSTNGLRVINAADTTILANFFDNGNLGIGTTTYTTTSGFTGVGINNATNGGCLDLLLNDVKKGELYISSTSFNMYGFAGVGLNLTVDNSAKGLAIATTGAATFSSSVTATQFNVSASGGATQIYNTGGGHTVITNATANKDINYQTSGTGGHYLNTAGVDRLIISSTGTAQFNSEDISGNRTTLNNVLTITQTNGNAPYSGFGSGILFKGTTYNGGGAGIPATRSWGRIAMQITDSSFGNTGENMLFQVAALDNSDALTTALTLAYNSAATFASGVTVGGSISATIGTLSTTYNGGSVGQLHITSNGTEGGTITFEKTSGTAQKYKLGLGTTSLFIYNETAGNQPFTLTSDGNIAIGTFATAGDKYFGYSHTNGGWGAGASGLRFESVAVGGNYSQSIYIRTHYYNADSRNAIHCRYDGNVYNFSNSTAWQTTSDIRIKENIRPINNALDKINALNPSHFEYKNKLGQTKTGFVAQEFERIFPGHVSEGLPNEDYKEYFKEGEMMKSIDADLIPYLVKAIQELKAEIELLKTK